MMESKKIFKWQIWGAVFIIILGTLMHFVYEWSGKLLVVGLIAPVSESVWEHLKLGFFPLIIFSIIEFYYLKDYVKNFCAGIFFGIVSLEIIILGIFYTYTAFTGHPILFVDISSFIIGAFVCQYVGYLFMRAKKHYCLLNKISCLLFIIHMLLFFIFTFYHPNLPIFIAPTI